MAWLKKQDTENPIEKLKEHGLTCSKLKSMISRQLQQAKQDRNDSTQFRTVGFEKQADYQEQIAKAQEKSAVALREVKCKLCPLNKW